MANGERFSIRYSLFTMKFSWRSNADSKAAGAWAIPTALPSSPIQLPSFRYGIRWASELKDLPNAPSQEDSQPDRRIIFGEFGRLRSAKWQCRDGSEFSTRDFAWRCVDRTAPMVAPTAGRQIFVTDNPRYPNNTYVKRFRSQRPIGSVCNHCRLWNGN